MANLIVRLGLTAGLMAILYFSLRPSGVSDSFLKQYGELFATTYNDTRFEEPLCVYAGPFPLKSRDKPLRCDRCDDLLAAGLLSRERVEEGRRAWVKFELTDKGKSIYTEDVDEDLLAIVKKRIATSGQADREPDMESLSKPRLCFGQQRFHHLEDALSPLSVSGNKYISVKLVTEAKNVNAMLWEPQMSVLKLPTPAKPEPGKPALYPAKIVTFVVMPDGKSADIDSMRYGKWVNEP